MIPEGPQLFKMLEPVMVFGVVLVILLWQWWSISAEIRRDRKKAQDAHNKDTAQP